MEADRFERQKKLAANSTSFLTPKGSFLRSTIISNAKEHKENFVVGVTKLENEDPPQYECEVRGVKEAWMVQIEIEPFYGCHEISCSCGMVEKDAVPCIHIFAAVKSKKIPNLMPTNVMPYCWTSEMWRKQFPNEMTNRCNIDMNFLKLKYEPNTKLRYMPDFVGKRKRGRPKGKKRIKSALELAMAKKKGKKRKRPADDDGLGPDDVDFGFTVSDYDGEVEL